SENILSSRDMVINWQFRFATLPRPNPHLLREDGGMRTIFVQTFLLTSYRTFSTVNIYRTNGTVLNLIRSYLI
ncbi:MAG TPA: hypothetical protein V6C91_21995, partial [Coleofasciculaceae cyanobacterium]